MPMFPAQYSTLSAAALAPFLSAHYQLGTASCRLLIRNVSDTYVLETVTERYIFKIYRDAHRKPDEIRAEVELLLKLRADGACVSYPLTAANGELLTRFEAAEGTRYGVLFTWAKGKVATVFTDEQLRTIGHEMARLHNSSASIQLKYPRRPYHAATTILEPLKNLEPAFKELPAEYEWLCKTGKTVAERITGYEQQFTNKGYCQFDFLPKNFHLDDANNITFFDFDFAGEGLLAYDLTSFFVHFFLEVTGGRQTAKQAAKAFRYFLNSYRQVRPFTDSELQAIPHLGFAFWLFYLNFQYESFDDWSSIFWSDAFIKSRVALMQKWMDTAADLLNTTI